MWGSSRLHIWCSVIHNSEWDWSDSQQKMGRIERTSKQTHTQVSAQLQSPLFCPRHWSMELWILVKRLNDLCHTDRNICIFITCCCWLATFLETGRGGSVKHQQSNIFAWFDPGKKVFRARRRSRWTNLCFHYQCMKWKQSQPLRDACMPCSRTLRDAANYKHRSFCTEEIIYWHKANYPRSGTGY